LVEHIEVAQDVDQTTLRRRAMESTAYNDYLRTDVLHSLQREVTSLEGERSFIVVCQVQELYWGLIVHELRAAMDRLRGDEFEPALAALRRAGLHFGGLNASWSSLEWMLPPDFQTIKQGMGAVHGRSSSLQSWTFREMLHLLGIRDESLLEPVESMPAQHAQLASSLVSPGVYDEVLAACRRAGLDVPQRSASGDEVDLAVASFWGAVLAGRQTTAISEIRELVPSLLKISEGLAEYRHLHYMATLRTLGGRAAYYGTSGVEWLKPTLTQVAFPDLWATSLPGEEEQS
jgi:tryptophan 2,3-dioxygenase